VETERAVILDERTMPAVSNFLHPIVWSQSSLLSEHCCVVARTCMVRFDQPQVHNSDAQQIPAPFLMALSLKLCSWKRRPFCYGECLPEIDGLVTLLDCLFVPSQLYVEQDEAIMWCVPAMCGCALGWGQAACFPNPPRPNLGWFVRRTHLCPCRYQWKKYYLSS